MQGKIEFAARPKEGQPWDVVIIGSGPASLTAAIYTIRGAVSTLILGGERWGGQLMLTTDVDNYPGFPEGVQGPDLMRQMRKQAKRFGAEFVEKDVEAVDFSKRPFELGAGGQKYLAKSVIVATGVEIRWLGVPGEDKLRGRGISSCAPCDAPFFKNKKVAVIGGGDSAMEEALVLTKYSTEVVLIHRRDELRASKAMQKKVLENPKIKILWNTEVTEFVGDKVLDKVKLKNKKEGRTSELALEGAFVAIGHVPSTEIFQGQVEVDEKGYIKKIPGGKFQMSTSVSGVFVAGDVHDYIYRQAVTAAGYGCMAALDTLKYLEELGDTKKV